MGILLFQILRVFGDWLSSVRIYAFYPLSLSIQIVDLKLFDQQSCAVN